MINIQNKISNKILVVDDQNLIRSAISDYLSEIGYVVDTAEDGKVAIDKLESDSFDLVLTDLEMPVMNGRELLLYMSEKYPRIPKIVLTGFGENEDIILALKAGANDFLYKPIGDYEIIHHSIKKALEIKKINDEKERYLQQLQQINEIITLLNEGKNSEEIFKSLSISLKKIIPYNRITLMYYDWINNEITVKLSYSDRKKILKEGFSIKYKPEKIDNKIENRRFKIINDLIGYQKQHESTPTSELVIENKLIEEGMRSSFILPLIINNVIEGFLHLSSINPDFFKTEYVKFMESIVGHIALSIERGEMIENLEKHTRNLEQTVEERTDEIIKTQRTTLFALSKLAESRDPETGEHLGRIRKYSLLTAKIYVNSGFGKNIPKTFLRDLYDSSILHDIGKVGIPDEILLKNSQLTKEEQEIIKKHIDIGYKALKSASEELGDNSFLKMAMEIILNHHERWDGSGYPKGLKGKEIPLSARIVTLSDVYDALRTKRPYKKAYSHEEAVKIMKKNPSVFDPDLFQIFLNHSSEYDSIHKEFIDK